MYSSDLQYHSAKDGLACYFTRRFSGVRGMIIVTIRGAWALNLSLGAYAGLVVSVVIRKCLKRRFPFIHRARDG